MHQYHAFNSVYYPKERENYTSNEIYSDVWHAAEPGTAISEPGTAISQPGTAISEPGTPIKIFLFKLTIFNWHILLTHQHQYFILCPIPWETFC